MRARRAATVLVWALLPACSSADALFVPPPDVDAFSSALVVVHDRSPPRGFAVDLRSEDWRVSVDLEEGDPPDVDLLAYGCDLASLALDAGPVAFLRDGGRPLIPPVRSWSALGNVDALVWSENVELPARVDQLRLTGEPPDLCADVDVEVIEIEGETMDPRLLAEDENGLVDIGSRAGRLFHLDVGTRTIVPAYEGARASGGLWMSAHADGAETVFFSSGRGCLGFSDDGAIRELSCLADTFTATAGSWTFMDGPTDSVDTLSLGILLGDGTMYVYRNGAFEEVPLEGTTDTGDKGGVFYVADDEILFAGPRQSQIVLYDGREAIPELLPLNTFDKITSVGGGGSPHGPLIVTNSGNLYARSGEAGWQAFAATAIPQARRITRLGDRYYVGGESELIEVLADGSTCRTGVNIGGDVRRMITVGTDIVVATDPPDGGGLARVFVLTPRIPEPSCP